MPSSLAPLHFPRLLVRAVSAHFDVPVTSLLARTGLSPSTLEDPRARISLAAHRRLVLNAQRLAGHPALGLWFGARFQVTWLGQLGFAALNAETLGEALRLIVRFFALRGPLMRPSVQREHGRVSIVFDRAVDYGPIRGFMADASLRGLLAGLAHFSPEPLRPHEAQLAAEPPDDPARHEAAFGCPVSFDAEYSALAFDPRLLEVRLPTADPLLAAQAVAYCEAELRRVQAAAGVAGQVEMLLVELLEDAPTLPAIASRLAMSPRTLKRRLQAEGASFRGLHEQVRRREGERLLADDTLGIAEVAIRLGYRDPANYTRAYRRWYGTSPAAARASMTCAGARA